MASGKDLPNLKICIDNESVESDDDLSLTEEPDITIGEAEPIEDSRKDTSATSDAEKDDVQFNVYLEKLEDEPRKQVPRRYENKEGDFVTGIDFTKQEEKAKREERAKRFGMPLVPEPEVDLEGLYKSLGIKPDDLERKDERGIRLEAVHIRGISEMNTKDVFDYFKEFAAGGIEWIDDSSCNIVWMDKMTAARAMLKLSSSYEQTTGISNKDNNKKQEKNSAEKKNSGVDPKTEGEVKQAEEDQENDRKEEKMEEDDDDLDLTEEKKKDENKNEESDMDTDRRDEENDKSKATSDRKQTADSDIEEGELPDSDSESNLMAAKHGRGEKKKSIPWPPGRWRLGVPYQRKAKFLFLRFATKADKKLPGAEKRSKYYQKYGNPNYGGMTGLISNSLKRKMRKFRDYEDSYGSRGDPSNEDGIGRRTAVSYDSVDMFTDNLVPVIEEGMELYSKSSLEDPRRSKLRRATARSDSEPELEEEEEHHPIIEKVVTNDRREGSDSDIDEAELERLLGRPNRKPSMKMYADEIEEKQKAKRQQAMVGALTIVADAKKEMRVTDARQLITGVDLRAARDNDMRAARDSDIRAKLSRARESSEFRSGRAQSPEDLRSRFQRRMSPVTIRARLDRSRSRSQEDMRSRITHRRFQSRSRSRSPVMVRSRLNRRRSPVNVRSRMNRRRSRSPLIIRSRVNRSRSPIDARSKLNKNRRSRIPASESDSDSSSSSDSDSEDNKNSNSSSSSSSSSNDSSSSSSGSSSDSSSDDDSDSSSDKRRRRKDLRGHLDSRKKAVVKSASKSKYPSMKIEVLD